MAKQKNKRPSIPQAKPANTPTNKPTGVLGGLFKSGEIETDSLETLLPKLDKDMTPAESVRIEEKTRQALKHEAERLDSDRKQLEQVRAELQQQKDALSNDRSQLEQEREALERVEQEFRGEKEKLGQKAAQLLTQERSLEERELDARNGFHEQNQKALRDLKKQISELEGRRTALEAEIAERRSEQEASLRAESARARENLQAEQAVKAAALDERENTLVEFEETLQQEQEELALKQQEFDRKARSREQVEAFLLSMLEDQFRSDLDSEKRKNSRLEEKLERLNQDLEETQNSLDEFSDFQAALRGKTPQEWLDEFEELVRENAELEREAADSDRRDSAEEVESLREELERAEDEVQKLRYELEGAKRHAHDSKMVVLEKEQWAQEKRVLEQHKQVLSAQINDLNSRITTLVDSQQAESAFPELIRMDGDSGFQTPRARDQVDDLATFTKELAHRIALTQPDNPLYFRDEDLQLFVGGLAMSQLHVFQGISGTGKTSLAKAFAKAVGGECQDIAVQAGWRDRSDLLGHYNAFEKRFSEKECLQAVYRASTPCADDRLNIVLLDEMNLSRPEQYFADFLSALEKQPGDRWIRLMETAPANAPRLFNEGREVRLPENLWFIGTANHDETTNELADKTHDRAFVLDLPRHEGGFSIQKGLKPRTYSFSSLREAFKSAQDSQRKDVRELLEFVSTSDLTKVLENAFGLGWGNRFERQAAKFLPVVKAAGGSYAQALDHLLATRMFRSGKVTGRFDINANDLQDAESALLKIFEKVDKNYLPVRCMSSVERDKKRMERGG